MNTYGESDFEDDFLDTLESEDFKCLDNGIDLHRANHINSLDELPSSLEYQPLIPYTTTGSLNFDRLSQDVHLPPSRPPALPSASLIDGDRLLLQPETTMPNVSLVALPSAPFSTT